MRPSLEQLEQKERDLFGRFYYLPNTPERERLYKQWREVYNKITLLVTE